MPAAVQRWFDGTGTSIASSIDAADGADAGAIRLGPVHRVSRFSAAFASGAAGTPLVAQRSWIAPALDHGRAIGTVSTSLPQDAVEPSTGGLGTDALLARQLTGTTGVIVEDPRTGAWYWVDGTRISPLNTNARAALPDPESLSDFQREYVADRARTAPPARGCPTWSAAPRPAPSWRGGPSLP